MKLYIFWDLTIKALAQKRKELITYTQVQQNYKRSEDGATYFGNWLRQTCNVMQKSPEKRYIRVLEEKDSFIPEPFENFSNLTHITVEEFAKSFNISTCISK